MDSKMYKVNQAKAVLDVTLDRYFSTNEIDFTYSQYVISQFHTIQSLLEAVDELLSDATASA